MRKVIQGIVVLSLLALIGWALSYISSEENSIKLSNDWGIAKDKPRK